MLRNHWYVALRTPDLATAPVGRTIHGRALVFFRDAQGHATALPDLCPHRRAPLSRGKVQDGVLRCAYHGMAFNGQGHCVDIPTQDSIPAAAHLTPVPVIERYGLVWVWPGDPARATAGMLPDLPWRDADGWNTETIQYFPVRAAGQLMVDNLLDLSHVAFIHERTIGFDPARLRNDPLVSDVIDDTIVNTRVFPGVVPPPGHRRWHDFAGLVDRTSHSRWAPPGIVSVQVRNQDPSVCLDLRYDHFITPETAASHHYFIAFARNFRIHDSALTQALDHEADAVHREDLEIVEAQQRAIEAHPNAPELALRQDRAIIAAHRILERLAREEESAGQAAGR